MKTATNGRENNGPSGPVLYQLIQWLLIGLLALGLGACASPQLRYHTLMPLAAASSEGGHGLRIENVTVPPQVNRSELVIRQHASGLMVLESDWWGAPLADEIRSALTARLAQSGPQSSSVSALISISRFDSVPGQYALIEASFQLTDHQDRDSRTLTCNTRLRSAAGQDLESLVIAHQHNLQALADQLLIAAQSLTAGKRECPQQQ